MRALAKRIYRFVYGPFAVPIYVNVYGLSIPVGLYERFIPKFVERHLIRRHRLKKK